MNILRLFKVVGFASLKAKKDQSFSEKFKVFLAMLNDFRKGLYRPKFGNFAISLLVFLYMLSPLDLFPEAFFGPLGLIDDLGIFMIGIKFLNKEIERYKSWKITQIQSIHQLP